WWVGTFVLALWATLLGELASAAAYRVNRQAIEKSSKRALYYQEQSLKARQAKDEKAYKMINKLANEAYGKSFFLLMAMGMGSLCPAFLAAAWLNERFGEFVFSLPIWAGGFELNFLAPFIILYIAARILMKEVRPRISLLFHRWGGKSALGQLHHDHPAGNLSR
ncbi:MAG: hypothetical protein JXL84_14335, partial [Deltaproteobacteria bacterium]|nr:hypothetical protein [Deltaproteobacteria bacterium]